MDINIPEVRVQCLAKSVLDLLYKKSGDDGKEISTWLQEVIKISKLYLVLFLKILIWIWICVVTGNQLGLPIDFYLLRQWEVWEA